MTPNRQIIDRFFQGLDALIQAKEFTGLADFCKRFGFNRVRYQNVRNHPDHPNYKTIEIEALYILVAQYNFSADWLLTGRGRPRI